MKSKTMNTREKGNITLQAILHHLSCVSSDTALVRRDLINIAKDSGGSIAPVFKVTAGMSAPYSKIALIESVNEAMAATPVKPMTTRALPRESQPTPPPPAESKKIDAAEYSYSVNSGVIPTGSSLFVKSAEFSVVASVIKSKRFFPIFISGESGNGKTMMVHEAAAINNRPLVRIQIDKETDEDDLIGGWRLINGNTVFVKGPIINAMELGAVVLIDEIDRGSNKIMCLQGVLEGNPVLIKKTGETVFPQPGFTIIATANTKGSGSEDGRYSAASVIDSAFLERFVITLEIDFASPEKETDILINHAKALGLDITENKFYISHLINWAAIVRRTYTEGGIGETISTRRLCHILNTMATVATDIRTSVILCTNRFEADVSEAMITLFDHLQNNEQQ